MHGGRRRRLDAVQAAHPIVEAPSRPHPIQEGTR